MKKLIIILFSVATMISFTQCSSSSADKLCSNADTRGKFISELMNNDTYMNQVMDSMRTKHSDAILSASFVIGKDNKEMQTEMLNNMMDMCKSDTSVCKMMMGKTMDMCDMDKSKCSLMVGSMQEHPTAMKTMQDMGMCDRKGMKMDKMK